MRSAKFRAALLAFALCCISANSQELLPLSLVASSSSVETPASTPSTLSLASASAAPYVTLSDHIKPKTREQITFRPFSTFAFGIKAGTLGSGIEIATPIARPQAANPVFDVVSIKPNTSGDTRGTSHP